MKDLVRILALWITAMLLLILAGRNAKAEEGMAVAVVGIWWHMNEPWRPVGVKGIVVDHDASAVVVCFCKNGEVRLVNALLMKQRENVAISIGDSGSRFLGTWKSSGSAGTMTYRLVDAGHALVPATVPGPEITRFFAVSGDRIRIAGDEFERALSLFPETIKIFFPCLDR